MTEETQNQEVESNKEQQEVDYKALYEQSQAEIEALAAKKEQLLSETKRAKEAKRQIEAEDRERAAKNGEYERLLEMEQAEKAKLFEELNTIKQNVLNEKINTQAHKLANEIKAIPESAEIVADLIARELKNVSDENGEISEAAIKALKSQFLSDEKYKPLLLGNQSNGGGATGAKGSAANVKEMSRSDFDKLQPMQKMEYMKNGGKLLD